MSLLIFFELFLSFALSKKTRSLVTKEVECPPIENGYTDIDNTQIFNSGNGYSCSKDFNTNIIIEGWSLRIYYCTFQATNGISISFNSRESQTNAEIYGCTFGESGDSSIKYGAPKGLIQKCVFNRGWAPQPDIIYKLNYDPSGNQYTDKLEIKDNTFNRPLIFQPTFKFTYYSETNVEFTGNKFVYESAEDLGAAIFDCTSKVDSIKWTFGPNYVNVDLPPNMIKSDNANALQVQITVGDPPSGGDGDGGGDGGGEEDEKCPEDPGDYTNSQIYTYTCGNDFIESPGLNAKNTILAVFYSTFTKIQPKDKNDANEFIIKALTSKGSHQLTSKQFQVKLKIAISLKCRNQFVMNPIMMLLLMKTRHHLRLRNANLIRGLIILIHFFPLFLNHLLISFSNPMISFLQIMIQHL